MIVFDCLCVVLCHAFAPFFIIHAELIAGRSVKSSAISLRSQNIARFRLCIVRRFHCSVVMRIACVIIVRQITWALEIRLFQTFRFIGKSEILNRLIRAVFNAGICAILRLIHQAKAGICVAFSKHLCIKLVDIHCLLNILLHTISIAKQVAQTANTTQKRVFKEERIIVECRICLIVISSLPGRNARTEEIEYLSLCVWAVLHTLLLMGFQRLQCCLCFCVSLCLRLLIIGFRHRIPLHDAFAIFILSSLFHQLIRRQAFCLNLQRKGIFQLIQRHLRATERRHRYSRRQSKCRRPKLFHDDILLLLRSALKAFVNKALPRPLEVILPACTQRKARKQFKPVQF